MPGGAPPLDMSMAQSLPEASGSLPADGNQTGGFFSSWFGGGSKPPVCG